MRYAGTVAIVSLIVAGCSDSKRKLPVGSVCESSEECADGLCLSGVCLDPEADEDGDGLINRIEGSLGTDPFSADSDGDGVDDPDELEDDLSARDSDGDGKPDAIESSLADADEDCLSDETDPDDAGPNHDDPRIIALVVQHCPQAIGACGADAATLAVTCRAGLTNPICSFGSVPDYEATEATCDDKDNDCDGDTDEPEACNPAVDPLRVGLIGHWRLDGDGQDAGPHADHGVVTGATPAPDRFGVAGKAMRFSAVGDRVSVPSTHHPLGEVTITYTAWVRPDPDFGAATGIMAFGDVLVPQKRSALVTWGPRSCLEYTGEQNDFGSGSACTPDRHWSFVAVVKSGRAVKLYLNGRLQGEGQLQPGQDVSSTALQIGLSKWSQGNDVYEQFRGVIDDVRAWSRTLTDAELAALYREGDWADVGSQANPAASCLHVRDGGSAHGDGSYWLDPAGSGAGAEAYCDMTTDGGGWTLVWSYGFTDAADFGQVTNAVTPVPNWRGGNIDVPVSTTAPASPTTRGAIDWAAWPAFGEEVLVRADFVDTIACRPAGPQSGSLARGLTGQIDCRVIEDETSTCDGTLPTWLGWHATGPMFVASSLFLYFDGALDINWPTHDPCGTNVPPPSGATTTGGAVFLRPTDAPIHYPTTCRWVPQLDRGRNEHIIDPDGPGGRTPFPATCDFVTERGGWTKLSPELGQAGRDRGNQPRELLFKKNGAWYRTPVTKELWSWTSFVEVPGLWVFDGPGGDGVFDCAGGVAGGWGMGCGTTGAERFLAGAGPSPTKDLANGLTTACQAPPDAFGIGGTGCVDDVEIWARPTRCMTDEGSMLGDGDFAQWADPEPDDGGKICWGVNGPEGTMVPDYDTYPPGGAAPSLRATNPTVGNDIWSLIVNQQDLTFIAGRAYQLGFWAKAASPRPIRVFVQTRDLTHAFYWEDVTLSTTWTWYPLGFVADATSYDAMVDFQLAEFSTAAVWLDDITLSDEGPSPCAPSGNDLVADGDFAAGRTCWRFGHDAQATAASAWPDPDDAPADEAPSMHVTHTGTTEPWQVTLQQDGLTLQANRHYRLSFEARASSPRSVQAAVRATEDWSVMYVLDRRIGTSWQLHTFDFVTSAASAPGAAHLHLVLGGPAGEIWLDGVSLVDVGPSPCVADQGSLLADGGFAAGLACWRFDWNRQGRAASAEPDMAVAPSGQAPALAVAHDPGTDQVHEVSLKQPGKTLVAGRWYRLSYWARGASARTIRAAVWDQDEHFAYYEDPVDTTWRQFVHDFRTTSGSTDAAVEFHLAAVGGETVWLDGVRLEDRGVDPCLTPDDGSLVADGGFAAGALCWGFGYNAELTTATATSDGDIPAGGTAPSLKVTQSPPPPNVWEVGTWQGGMTIEAGRWYRLTFRAKAAASRPIVAAVWDDVNAFLYRTPTIGTSWQTYTFDFAPDIGSAAGLSGVSFQLADPSGATVWLDDVRLEDKGPSPCVTSGDELLEDGELTAGLLCWLDPGPQGRYEPSADHPPATAAPSLAITNLVEGNQLWDVQLIQRGFALVEGQAYTLRFWARAAAPRTIAAMVQNWDTQTMHTYHIADVGTSWAEYVYDFDGANTEVNALVELQFGQASTATVWVDGLSLVKRSAPIPTQGLVAHFDFDAGADDLSGHGNHGVVHGGVGRVTDRHGTPNGAFDFDGEDDYIVAPTEGYVFGGGDRTLAFWIKPDTGGPGCGSTGASVVQYGSGDCVGKMFGAGYCQASWYFWGGCYDWWPSASDPAYGAISQSAWSFVAMRLSSGVLTVRVDDIVMTNDRSSLSTQAGPLIIGLASGDGAQSISWLYDGKVDDVRVYDRALTDSEIDALRAE